MTLAEAVKFAGEETAWLRAAGRAAAPPVDVAMQRLLDLTNWMVAAFPNGPLWYRGLAEAPEETLIDGLTAMLARLRVQYIVVGHTPQPNAEIVPRFGGRVFLIDTGMLLRCTRGGRRRWRFRTDILPRCPWTGRPSNFLRPRQQSNGSQS